MDGWGFGPRIKEDVTSNKDIGRHDRLVKWVLSNPSAEGIDRQTKHEFRQGYPKATEAEIQMLFDANKKAGSPPRSLARAKLILSDNVWVFTSNYD
jgi:hypothetical protein